MKAKYLETKEVDLKPGDKVSVYVTIRWGAFDATASTTALEGVGVVVRVYRHIGAVVVRFGKRTQFIRERDSRYSIWRVS